MANDDDVLCHHGRPIACAECATETEVPAATQGGKASDFIRRNAVAIEEFAGSRSQLVGLVVFLLELAEKDVAEAGKAQAEWTELRAELQKHQDLVEALQWLPAGTVVDFCDLDDFLEELRKGPWGWRPRRECSHEFLDSDSCVHCGIDADELPLPPQPSAPEGT